MRGSLLSRIVREWFGLLKKVVLRNLVKAVGVGHRRKLGFSHKVEVSSLSQGCKHKRGHRCGRHAQFLPIVSSPMSKSALYVYALQLI